SGENRSRQAPNELLEFLQFNIAVADIAEPTHQTDSAGARRLLAVEFLQHFLRVESRDDRLLTVDTDAQSRPLQVDQHGVPLAEGLELGLLIPGDGPQRSGS